MSTKTYPVDPSVAQHAHIDAAKYQQMYAQSVEDPDAFWGRDGEKSKLG